MYQNVDRAVFIRLSEEKVFDKNLDRELRKKLKKEERKNELEKTQDEKYESYLDAAAIFFGTLVPLYILFYMAYRVFMFSIGFALSMLSLPFTWILPLIHAAIWVASIYSVYRKRSVLDELIQWL